MRRELEITLRDLRASSDRGLRTLRPSLREEMMSLDDDDDVLLLVKEVEDICFCLMFELMKRKETNRRICNTFFIHFPGLFSIVGITNYWQNAPRQHYG